MNLKKIVKWMIPAGILDIYRSYKRMSSPRSYIWAGVYKHYRDVPTAGEGLDITEWVGITRAETEAVLANLGICGAIPNRVTGERSLLPLLASFVCQNSGRVRILDFGGGMGIDYVFLVNSLTACPAIDYYVVESEKMCREGGFLFEKDDRIYFCSSLPENVTDIDIVHVNSVLQYIEDYTGLLRRLSTYRPRFFLFVRLSAGDFPTYATAQKNMPGMTLAYWFINVNEIIEIMSACGYSLVFKSASVEEYNQDNFPQQYRLGRTCNLLFARD